ncbi:sentrin-specific protease 6 isoform X2 [Narcine bancroftii]|uniref:sentrin-specific protease 6 isoform X2 n=1 Tax=Narcine bancroftii TaxID=1343680 RepID=UPI00383133A5
MIKLQRKIKFYQPRHLDGTSVAFIQEPDGCGEETVLISEALDRTAVQNDRCIKNKWSCEDGNYPVNLEKEVSNLLSTDNEEMEAEKIKTKASISSESVKTANFFRSYTRKNQASSFYKSLKGNAIGFNMLGLRKKLSESMSTVSSSHGLDKEIDNNRSKCFVISSSSGPGIVVRGRRFQHANAQSNMKTAAQRKEYPVDVQRVPMDNIILMEPDAGDELEEQMHSLSNIQRRILSKQAKDNSVPVLPESINSAAQNATPTEGQSLSEFFSLCNNCGKKSEDHTKCENCRKPIPKDATRRPKQALDSVPQPRPPIRASSPTQAEGGVGVSGKTFYNKPFDITLPSVPTAKFSSIRNNLLQTNGNIGLVGRTGRVDSKKSLMNDPIVLSSDEEEQDDNASTGSGTMDSVHSIGRTTNGTSPPLVLSNKPLETASEEVFDGNATEQILENICTEIESTATLPRKARMKDKFGNPFHEIVGKKRKIELAQAQMDSQSSQVESSCESIILKCRSIRIGTYRATVLEPVIFSLDFIKVNVGVPRESSQQIVLEASEFTKCEWCSARILPVLFLQLTSSACRDIQSSLNMSKEKSWFDSEATNIDERYIVLIFESVLELRAAAIFERILTKVGKKNKISNFFSSIPFVEANNRLLMFTQNIEEHKSNPLLKDSRGYPKYCLRNTIRSNDDGSGSCHSSFTGPIKKLIVYPPPPSKGGISVTNEDLYCLKEGEFLNDVIIDFYLKYLVLEKIKQQDADRIHIFSSFFYKRLNQRERRNVPDSVTLSLPQRRHARVKTWTRHVDLFQKDFVFVPINETAHWFLAVICFPGLCSEPNLKLQEDEGMQHNSNLAESNMNSASLQEEMDSLADNSDVNEQRKSPDISRVPEDSVDSNCESVVFNKLHIRRCLSATNNALDNFNQLNKESEDRQNSGQKKENGMEDKQPDSLKQIEVSYADDNEDPFDFLPDQEYSQDDSNDTGSMAEDSSSESVPWGQQPSKQPCILIMDSLRGPSRANVVKILREYLEVEWEMRKASKRSFTKDMIKGSNPRVPQQDNFSDCGVYVLQYVESFFENPIPSFELPMNLIDWFPQQQVKKKREEIRNVILKLCETQSRGENRQEFKATEAPS